jgi:nicotinamide-nucleotide amidase
MTFPTPSLALAERLLKACVARELLLVTAESCTGGLIIGCLTEIPGSSSVVERGYVTYDNRAKQELLGVPAELLARVGAVSEEVARAMAEGALARAGADLALAVTGIAGPSGATPGKPVGLVHLAVARRGQPTLHAREFFQGDRSAVRLASVDRVLELALSALADERGQGRADQSE